MISMGKKCTVCMISSSFRGSNILCSIYLVAVSFMVIKLSFQGAVLFFMSINSYLHLLFPDKESVEQPSGTVVSETVIPGVAEGKNDGTDAYDADPSFSVRKSPPQNGVPVSEKASGAGGLGEGTPKVCCPRKYHTF